MILDAEYFAWLARDATRRCMLADLAPYSSGAVVSRYVATHPVTTRPVDTPANAAYEDVVAQAPTLEADVDVELGGPSLPIYGDLMVRNDAGAIDSWLADGWDGRAVRLWVGDPDWLRSDFRSWFSGVSDDLYASGQKLLGIKLRGKEWMLDTPLQKTLLTSGTSSGQPVPLAYGQVFNVEPVLIDAATHRYKWNDGPVNALTAVRAGGLAISYTADNANGEFTLGASPTGRVTLDGQGMVRSGSYLTKCADICRDVIAYRSLASSADIDDANFSAFNTTCPQGLGFYARERWNVRDVLDWLVRSVGGFRTESSDGKFQLGRIEAPSGTPALELVQDDVAGLGQLDVERRILPVDTYRLGYARNWTPQADGLLGAVTEANRDLYGRPYSVVKAANAGITTQFPRARNPEVVDTLIVSSSDAQAECDRRRTLWSVLRRVLRGTFTPIALQAALGQVARVTHPRLGLSGGVLAAIAGYRKDFTGGRVRLRLFV